MEYADLLKYLGDQIGGTLTPTADGLCQIEVDELPLSFQSVPELATVVLLGEVGPPPPEQPTQLYETLLGANHLFKGTFGATLSRDPANGVIMLCKTLACAALDGPKFVAEIEQFLATQRSWRQIVLDYRASVEAPSARPPEPSAPDAPAFDPESQWLGLGMGGDFMRV